MNQETLPDKNTEIPAPLPQADETGGRKILMAQAVLILLISAFFFYQQNAFAAQSALFGGLIAMLNVWTAERALRLAAKLSKASPGSEVSLLYMGAVQRFVVTLILFVLGMFVLKLLPLPLMVAFAGAQMGYVFKHLF